MDGFGRGFQNSNRRCCCAVRFRFLLLKRPSGPWPWRSASRPRPGRRRRWQSARAVRPVGNMGYFKPCQRPSNQGRGWQLVGVYDWASQGTSATPSAFRLYSAGKVG